MANALPVQKRFLFVGLSGSGKSTVIRFGLGLPAVVGDSWQGETCDFLLYPEQPAAREVAPLVACDSAGLGEGDEGKVKPDVAVSKLVQWLKEEKRGYNAVVIVIKKDRFKKDLVKTLQFFNVIIEKQVPRLYICTAATDDDIPGFRAEMAKYDLLPKPADCLAVDLPNDPKPNDPMRATKQAFAEQARAFYGPRVLEFLQNRGLPNPVALYTDLRGFLKLFRAAVAWFASWLPFVKSWVRDAMDRVVKWVTDDPAAQRQLALDLYRETNI